MPSVTVVVLAPLADPGSGALERYLEDARDALAEHHRQGFLAAGADTVVIRREPPDDTPFGARLRRLVDELRPTGGLVILGATSIPLATLADRRTFVAAAAADVRPAAVDVRSAAAAATDGRPTTDAPTVIANVGHSADVIAIPTAAAVLRDLPADLSSDNALPRWLAEVAGMQVRDLRARRHLAMDIDSPLDLLLLEGARGTRGTRGARGARGTPPLPMPTEDEAKAVRAALARLRELADDPGAELLVAGRTSAVDLRWLERHTRSRTRALVEERGLRTAAAGVLVGRPNRRPARSLLGTLLDRDGPGSLGRVVATLADGALIDSRVLLAHRLGADERAWPPAEDRFASDLLLADRVRDPWLAELTASAAGAPVPILLGAHSLVGPGVRLARRIGQAAGQTAGQAAGRESQPGTGK